MIRQKDIAAAAKIVKKYPEETPVGFNLRWNACGMFVMFFHQTMGESFTALDQKQFARDCGLTNWARF